MVKKQISIIPMVISFVIVMVFAGIVFVSWYSERVSENLKGYSVRLERIGSQLNHKISQMLTQIHKGNGSFLAILAFMQSK